MRTAQHVASSFGAETKGRAGVRHHLYVVLLEAPVRRVAHGLYVGQTSLDPDVRFDQHKAGYKASRAVRRFGIGLLPQIVAHLNPLAAWESIELEAALAEALREAGIAWVEGGH
jgi:hypothetical protein